MKTIIVQGDGIAGLPSQALDGKTPLQAAKTDTLDFLACHGEYGVLKLPDEGISLTGDVTHLALMGYDPKKYYSGPGPWAGAGLEVVLGPQDVAFLCSFVTLGSSTGRADAKKLGAQVYLQDDTAGSIETEDARELIDAINEQLGSESIQFYAGTGHRHLMVWVGGRSRMICHDPHFVVGHDVEAFLPKGEGADVLKELMEASRVILGNHPLNREREDAGRNPANCLWLWGPGKAVDLPKFKERYGFSGVTISNSDLHLGISGCAGWQALNVEPTSNLNGSLFHQYVEAAVKVLQQFPVVYLHVQERPDPGATYLKEKIGRVEQWDQELVGSLIERLPALGDFRLLVVCNHWGGEREGDAITQPTPFVLYESSAPHEKDVKLRFNEVDASCSPGGAKNVIRFVDRLFSKSES